MPGSDDRKFSWRAKRLFFNLARADDILGSAAADDGSNAGAPVVAVAGDGSGLSVVQIGADLDEVSLFRPIPFDLDRDKKVLGRIWFLHSATDADEPVFTVKTKFHARQVAVADFDTADDQSVAFAAHVCSTTAGSLEVTKWTDLEWDQSMTADDIAVALIIIATTMSGSANEVELYGIELMYEVDALTGRHRETTDKMLLSNPT